MMQQPPEVHAPDGVLVGTKAMRDAQSRMLSPEEVRRGSNREHEDLQKPDLSGENGYDDPVNPGENPWDIYSRTQIKDYEEAKHFAALIAVQIPRLRQDPKFAGAPFLNMPLMTAAYHIELVLRKSIGRLSLIEALMSKVGMYSPDTFMGLRERTRKGKGSRERGNTE